MGMLVAFARALGAFNATVLALGRAIGIVCIALMVAITLVQVIFRYGIGQALPWPDEAARFLMLWMTGLMAPTAFRRGGFVAIDMLLHAMPSIVRGAISLVLLLLSLAVLTVGFRIGWADVTGLGGRFSTTSLYYPLAVDLSAWAPVPRAWTMASLAVGVTLMISVNIELIARSLVRLSGAKDSLPVIPLSPAGAE